MLNDDAIMEQIERLKNSAKCVLDLKNISRKRRPIIIEFCGSPKSGKTSCISSLNIFLKRNKFKTAIISEKASICPVASKKDPVFNIWTLNGAINEIIESLYSGYDDIDIVICDRGIYDSICWFEWLKSENCIDNCDMEKILKYAMFDRWLRFIDLVYVFTASPEVSIEREYANLLTREEGSIMNKITLTDYLNTIKLVSGKYDDKFHCVKHIDTTHKTQNAVSEEVTSSVLNTLKSLLMEKVSYFDKDILDSIKFGFSNYLSLKNYIDKNELGFNERDIVENNNAIQPIPIAIITNKERNKILNVRKTEKATKSGSPEYKKDLIYIAGHIREEDNSSEYNGDFIKLAKATLKRELLEEINLSNAIETSEPYIIYTPKQGEKNNHFAVCFIIELDFNKHSTFKLDPYELTQGTGKSKSGKIIELEKFSIDEYRFEPWSIEILKNVFNVEVTNIQLAFQISMD